MIISRIKNFISQIKIPLLGAILVFLTCMMVLYTGGGVGLSDNEDFGRVMQPNRIQYIDRTDNNYIFNQHYTMTVSGRNVFEKLNFLCSTDLSVHEYSSPHFIFVKISKVANYISNIVSGANEDRYNIFWLAFLYILMFSAAAYMIISFFESRRMQVFVLVCLIFFFCDAGYILYFNSFYGEALQFVCLMLLTGLGLSLYRRISVIRLLFFYIVLYLFAGSKLVNIPVALVIGVFSLAFLFCSSGKRIIKISIISMCMASIIMSLGLYFSVPKWMESDTTYQAVFFGILKESPTPQKDLQELGLKPEYIALAGTHAYLPQYPIDIHSGEFRADLLSNVSKPEIASFYLEHPGRFLEKIDLAVKNSAYIRPAYLGNTAGERLVFTKRFSMWSGIRAHHSGFSNLWVVMILLVLLTLWAVLKILRYKRSAKGNMVFILAVLSLVVNTFITLVLPVVGNGEADIAKHMFLFVQFFDILMVCMLVMTLRNRKKIWELAKYKRVVVACVLLILTVHAHPITGYFANRSTTVVFGTYGGKSIKWQVVGVNSDGSKTLISADILEYRPFSGDSAWADSDIRKWLNSDFLSHFTAQEQQRMIAASHRVVLSGDTPKSALDSGSYNHLHYWTYEPSKAASMIDTAYQDIYVDMVYLPSLQQVQDGHFDKRKPKPYWTIDPYTRNTQMARYVNTDGFVLHGDSDRVMGVRPVITVF